MKKLPVLIINSYAGSLTIATRQEGHRVVGSYEDGGYGLEIQRANFPALDYRPTVADWPVAQDLSQTLVIAHPPCAAFSQQNITRAARGVDAVKFQQTRAVLEYAMRNQCAGLAVESVCGALEGARAVHDELAARHGYRVYRVLQNAVSFGVPQWRERFWAIFLPRQIDGLRLPPVPNDVRPLRTVLQECGMTNAHDLARWDRQLRMLTRAAGPRWAARLAHGDLGHGSLVRPLRAELARRGAPAPEYRPRSGGVHAAGSLCATAHAWCCSEHADSTTTFLCRVARLLDPRGLAGAVLGDAWWVWAGQDMPDGASRPLYEEEYKRIMGFPADYDFSAVRPRLLRTYLSRGVCPPAARWVLQGLQASVEGRRRVPVACEAGQTLDLRPARADVRTRLAAYAESA